MAKALKTWVRFDPAIDEVWDKVVDDFGETTPPGSPAPAPSIF